MTSCNRDSTDAYRFTTFFIRKLHDFARFFLQVYNWQIIMKFTWSLDNVCFVIAYFLFLEKNHPAILVKCTVKYLSSICRWSQTLRPFMKTWKYPVDSILYNSIMTLAIALIAKRSSSILMVVTFERRNIRIKVREKQRLEPIQD